MIYTVTINPSLDYVMHLDALNINQTNRSTKEEVYPGGKGINVSIVLKNLNIRNKALGFIAGFTGHEIERLVNHYGVVSDFINLDRGNSRINVNLNKINNARKTVINGIGPKVTPQDIRDLNEKLAALKDGDFLILAGSIPNGVSDDIYKKILKSLPDKQINLVIDATGELLLSTLKYKPFLIKPNHHELAETFGVEIKNEDDIVIYGRKLQEMGAQNVLVSLGENGAILLTHNGDIINAPILEGNVVNTVGAGDSMVAGFVAGYLKTNDLKQALRWGVAAGSATAFAPWLATKDDIDELLTRS
ncbi:1-phosphofructokinase [Cellulosilyticum sp. I15G10I2]|uniref:1-phosphofructokinase n=1 Tax=Cellulosilyticum sp. I15G10I2 TaxID=1892843 RepID=UPI00085C293D|nr:1-phosphofructokinase [Cellulosilyticum sp. I15G10I2]